MFFIPKKGGMVYIDMLIVFIKARDLGRNLIWKSLWGGHPSEHFFLFEGLRWDVHNGGTSPGIFRPRASLPRSTLQAWHEVEVPVPGNGF